MTRPPSEDPDGRSREAAGPPPHVPVITEQMIAAAAAERNRLVHPNAGSATKDSIAESTEIEADRKARKARQHPVFNIILASVLGIGLLLIGTGLILDASNPRPNILTRIGDAVVTEESEQWTSGLKLHADAESILTGIGCELTVGAIMLLIFVNAVYDVDSIKIRIGIFTGAILIALILLFAGYRCWPNVWSGIMWSMAVEIIGSIFFFAIVDAVIDAIEQE